MQVKSKTIKIKSGQTMFQPLTKLLADEIIGVN